MKEMTMRIAACLPFLLWAAGETRADYVKSSVSLGGYLVDDQGGPDDGGLFNSERVILGAQKGALGADLSFSRSDFQDIRPNTYENANRLAIAKVRYAPAVDWLRLSAGRDFMPMTERSLYFDGASARLDYKGVLQGELFGGYGVPTVYEEDIVNLDSDRALVGGKLTYSPFRALTVYADGLVNGIADDGSLALGIQGAPHERLSLSGSTLFRRDSSAITNADVSALYSYRKGDEIQLRYTYQDEKIDSSRYYHFFVNEAHQTISGGYLLYLNRDVQVNLDYGVLLYEDATGHLIDLRVRTHGLFAGVSKEWETVSEMLNVRFGYEALYGNRFRIALDAVYSSYDLSENRLDLKAMDFSFRPGLVLGKGFEATLGYEFLQNEIFQSDHRFFAGVKHVFFKGLAK